jgi:hypothetical protein
MGAFQYSALSAQPSAASLHWLDGGYAASRNVAAPLLDRTANRESDEANYWTCVLDRYLAGWIEADPDQIIAATEPGYRFYDPLVGQFSRRSLPTYFKHLQARFASVGASGEREYAFCFRGPMDAPLHRGQRDYFREAPALGLTGVATISIGERGVVAECVAYDLNLASDVLRSVP